MHLRAYLLNFFIQQIAEKGSKNRKTWLVHVAVTTADVVFFLVFQSEWNFIHIRKKRFLSKQISIEHIKSISLCRDDDDDGARRSYAFLCTIIQQNK